MRQMLTWSNNLCTKRYTNFELLGAIFPQVGVAWTAKNLLLQYGIQQLSGC